MNKNFLFPVICLLALNSLSPSIQAATSESDCPTLLRSCKSMALNLTSQSKSADCQASLDQCTKAKAQCKTDPQSLSIASTYHLHTRNTCK